MDKFDAPEWKPMTDWSGLPDVYVTKAECQQGMFWRIEACSVPMAIGPEVRLIHTARVAQQLADAEARGMERAANIAENADYPWAQGDHLNQMDASDATARAIAATIRAESVLTQMARLGQEWEREANVGTHETHVGKHEK